MAQKSIKRVNVRMGEDLANWFEKKADELGMSTGSLMIVALAEFRKSGGSLFGPAESVPEESQA